MSDDFKKLDDWMMDAAKRARENRVPEKDIKDFHDGVMKKIIERQNRGPVFPYAGFVMVAVLSLAVIGGAAFYMRSIKIEKEEAQNAENVVLQRMSDQAAIPAHYASLDAKDNGKQFMSGSLSTASAPSRPAAPLTESNILDEIEALKELGAWTDDDEAEAGIPADVTFSDLEVGMNMQPQAVPAPAA